MRFVLRFSIVSFLSCSAAVLFAQITITKSDVDANYINSRWIQVSDTTTQVLALGTASSSPQSFDLSNLTIAPATARFDTVNYELPGGHVLSGDFPTASACLSLEIDTTFGPYAVIQTFAQYFSSENNGVYGLGYAFRQQISPAPPPPFSADTSFDYFYHPEHLELPLPLTLGTTRSSTDTLTDANTRTITETSITADGFGTITFPGGLSLSGIRVVRDEIITITSSGGTTRYPKTRYVEFYAQDLTQIRVEVDTLYSGGTVAGVHYNYQKRTLAVGVNERFNNFPLGFHLAQNYPNPFNPTTTIGFTLGKSEFVTLGIYDMLGREVALLIHETLNAGEHSVEWNASNQPSGLYYYRLEAGHFSDVKKLLLLK